MAGPSERNIPWMGLGTGDIQSAAGELKAVAINITEMHRMFRSFAEMRVLATQCMGIQNTRDLWFSPTTTRVDMGSNMTRAQYEDAIVVEYKYVVDRYTSYALANSDNPKEVMVWLARTNKSRIQYAKTYQQGLDEIVKINAEARKLLTFGYMSAAVGGCVAELALILATTIAVTAVATPAGAALAFGRGAGRYVVPAMTRAIMLKKIVILCGAATAVDIAEQWKDINFDFVAIIIDDVKAGLQAIPGAGMDYLEMELAKLSGLIDHKNAAIEAVRGNTKYFTSKAARQNARRAMGKEVKNMTLQGERNAALAGRLTKLGYLAALWGGYDSLHKFYGRAKDVYNNP